MYVSSMGKGDRHEAVKITIFSICSTNNNIVLGGSELVFPCTVIIIFLRIQKLGFIDNCPAAIVAYN